MITDRMDVLGWLRNQLEDADTDLLRQMVQTFAEALMSAEADPVCGAPYGQRSDERVNRRNGSIRRPHPIGPILNRPGGSGFWTLNSGISAGFRPRGPTGRTS